MNDADAKNALAPFELILSIAGMLLLVGVLLAVPAMIFGGGSFLGIGDSDVCVTAPQSVGSVVDVPEAANVAHIDLRRGVRSTVDTVTLCDPSPSVGQRTWWWFGNVPEVLYGLVFWIVAWRLTRTGRHRGLFSPHLALAVGRLGLFVLLGAVAVALLRALADWRLVITMVAEPNNAFNVIVSFFQLSWATLFAGFGLLTVGRVMARTVPMQREIDATI